MKRILFLLCCLLSLNLFSQENAISKLVEEYKSVNKEKTYDLLSINSTSRITLPSEIKEYSILKLNKKELQSLLNSNFEYFTLTLPTSDRNNLTLELFEDKNDDLVIKTSDSDKQFKYKPGRHFKGIVAGQKNSVVALSFFEDDIMGFISEERGEGNFVIGKLQESSDYIVYKDNELLKKLTLDCAAVDNEIIYTKEELFHNHGSRALTDCVKMYFEVDYNIFQQKGGTTQTVNYVTGLYNQVAALYLAESIKTTLSEVFVWSTTSPYTSTNSSGMLNQFTAYRNGFNGNIAMLLSYSASGGIAYVNTLCNSNPDFRMGFSSIGSTYANVPTYSWSVEVVAHEFGHIFGSQHTHACVWNGNNTAIDGCYAPEGSCANVGLPSGGGTIMSYCHLTSAGINFANGFGTQPGNLIRSKVAAASCLSACPGSNPPTCTDGIQNGQETGIDCGGPTCPPCSSGCNGSTGNLALVLDNYPNETTWNIKNASGVNLYSGGTYSVPNSTLNIPVCLPNGCYTLNIFDTYGDGICCIYGQGSFNLILGGSNVASGGQFTYSKTISFCIGTSTPTCTDGIKNGQETGVDCGGPTCPPCPTCNDGIKNGQETGVDCGGPTCPACPTCTDGIKNGQETGIDCGGPSCPPCPTQPTCTDGVKNGQETGVDCGGPTCPPCPSCSDGIKNGQETGIDCGGSICPPCPSQPTCTDGIQNGQETGIDCGGPSCPPCPSTGTGTSLGAYYFETGWDNWVDGGEDAERYTGSRSYEGVWSIALRDDSGVLSSMTSPTYANAANFQSIKVEFNFFAFSMEVTEDFSLQYSNNGGTSWTSIGNWISGTHFNNNTFYAVTVAINKSAYNFTSNTKFRFVCDASTNSDVIYIDAVKITGLANPSAQGSSLASLSSIIEPNYIKVYPNPASTTLNIGLPIIEEEMAYELFLYDITGKAVIKASIKNQSNFDISHLSNGLYVLKVTLEGENIHTQKIVINK